MTIKQLDALKTMANALGYSATTITVEQYIQLYDVIKPALDKIEDEDEQSDFVGVDTSEI